MAIFLAGLIHLVFMALILQLLANSEMENAFSPLIKLAVGLWILQFILGAASHKW